jgi:CopG family transcriptional regulator/antitoxin EndoAI
MERITIAIPTDLLKDVDTVAKRLRQDRSQLVRQALVELLGKLKQQESEALLAEGYLEMFEENATIVAESLPLQAAATEGVWKWDE